MNSPSDTKAIALPREDRHRAACLAMSRAPVLMRFAARYTRNVPDAEDAYQRSLEIALIRAPTADERAFLAWFFAVLRHEAMAVAASRRREGPTSEDDLAYTVGETVAAPGSVEATVWHRHRYRALLEALDSLTEAQRICLILQCGGASYSLIAEITGYSLRKIERSVIEGRKGLQRWDVELVAGVVCSRLTELIARTVSEEATRRERLAVSRHIRHCGACRARLRRERETRERLAALAPLPLLLPAIPGPPDPSPALAWWDRITSSATVHTGTAVNAMVELPASGIGRIGAGTAAIVLAAAAGVPLVVDSVQPGSSPPSQPAPITRANVAPTPSAPAPSPTTTPARPVTPATTPRVRTEVRASAPSRAERRAVESQPPRSRPQRTRPEPAPTPPPAAAPAPRPPAPAPSPPSTPTGPDRSVVLEFGP